MLRTYVPLLACVALLTGGCGGDDDDSSDGGGRGEQPEQRLTKAEYVAQANRICTDTADVQEDYEERIESLDRGDLEAAAPVIEEVLDKTREGYERLRALSPPAAQEADVRAYLASVERLLATRDKLTQAARDDDRAAGERAGDEGDKIDVEQERLAERLGLDACENIF